MCFLPPAGLLRSALTAGPNILADFNFATPSIVGIGGNGTYASTYATDEWLLQETSGTYSSNTGGTAIDTFDGTGLLGQSSPGQWDGASYVARKAWESTGTASRASCSDTTALDSDGVDIAVRFTWRVSSLTTGILYMCSKRSATNAGWFVYASSNNVYVGMTGSGGTKTCPVMAVDAQDGALHEVSFFLDVSANTLYAKSGSVSVSVDTTGMGSITGAGLVSLGKYTAGSTLTGLQIGYLGGCVGANAQNFYNETVVLPGADPTGLLTTISRASLISVPVSATQVAHFAAHTLPIGYNANFTSGYGDRTDALTNLVPYSELSTGATNTNVTPTDKAADSPDGFRSGTSLLATANSGYQEKVCVTVAATQYTGSIYIEESTAGVAGRIVAYDLTNGAEIANTPFTGSSSPVDYSVTFTTPALCVSVGLRCEITTSGETVIPTFWQLNLGSARYHYVRTNGAAATSIIGDFGGTGNYVLESTGEGVAVFVLDALPATGETHYIFDTVTAADRRALYVDDTGAVKFLVNDSAGSLVATVTLGTASIDTEYTAQCQWDDAAGLGTNSVRAKLNALSAVVGGAAFTSGGGYAAEVSIGSSNGTSATAPRGLIQDVKFYDGQNAI